MLALNYGILSAACASTHKAIARALRTARFDCAKVVLYDVFVFFSASIFVKCTGKIGRLDRIIIHVKNV